MSDYGPEVCARVLVRCELVPSEEAMAAAANRDERTRAARRSREVRWLFREAQRLARRDARAVLAATEPSQIE